MQVTRLLRQMQTDFKSYMRVEDAQVSELEDPGDCIRYVTAFAYAS